MTGTHAPPSGQRAAGPAGWVAQRLGVRLRDGGGPLDACELAGLAVRRNARRAHLLVSTVLGKHVPTDPRVVAATGRLLGVLAGAALADRPVPAVLPGAAGDGLRGLLHRALRADPGAAAELRDTVGALPGEPADAVVLGYAETATGLGHCVAGALPGADYLHSTRRAGGVPFGGFEEEHSHATGHLLRPADPAILTDGRPLILVDDELSTGRTVANTIAALHRVAPRERYLVATLLDTRSPADAAALERTVAALGARLQVVSLAAGRMVLPADLAGRTAAVLEQAAAAGGPPSTARAGDSAADASGVTRWTARWPAGLPVGGRHGIGPAQRRRADAEVAGLAAELDEAGLHTAGSNTAARVLVLGTEELMHLPLRLAETLADRAPAREVRFSTTTRSPVLAVDDPDYPIRSALTFPAHDHPADGPGHRFAYNVRTGEPWDVLVVLVDAAGDTPEPAGLLAALTPHARRVLLVTVPDGPGR